MFRGHARHSLPEIYQKSLWGKTIRYVLASLTLHLLTDAKPLSQLRIRGFQPELYGGLSDRQLLGHPINFKPLNIVNLEGYIQMAVSESQ